MPGIIFTTGGTNDEGTVDVFEMEFGQVGWVPQVVCGVIFLSRRNRRAESQVLNLCCSASETRPNSKLRIRVSLFFLQCHLFYTKPLQPGPYDSRRQ